MLYFISLFTQNVYDAHFISNIKMCLIFICDVNIGHTFCVNRGSGDRVDHLSLKNVSLLKMKLFCAGGTVHRTISC